MSRLFRIRKAQKQDDLEQAYEQAGRENDTRHVPATSGLPLLPRPLASMVSFMTQSTSLSLRIGTFVGGAALDGARTTTLTGLELSRAMVEGILTRAGRDLSTRSSGEYGKAEAESLLERSLATLHSTITSASFFAAASFHLSSSALLSAANVSQSLLSTLDATLGSTESSRAIAAIVTLFRSELRELNDTEFGTELRTQRIGVADLLVGCVGFALLQRWGRKSTERHVRGIGGVESVWDVVILDNGVRADVVGTHQVEQPKAALNEPCDDAKRSSFMTAGNDDEVFDAIQRPASIADTAERSYLSVPLENPHRISDEDIRLYIMRQLPQGCHASIRTDLIHARTITVEIFDEDIGEIAAPPGTMMIEERHHDTSPRRSSNQGQLPKHMMVFRTAFTRSNNSDVRPASQQDSVAWHAGDEQKLPRSHREVVDQPYATTNTYSAEPAENKVLTIERPTGPSLDPRGSLDSAKLDSSVSEPQSRGKRENTTKGSPMKSSLTKAAQKIKASSVDKKDAGKRLSTKFTPEKTKSPPTTENAIAQGRPFKGTANTRKISTQQRPAKCDRSEVYETAAPSPKRGSSIPVANRGLPRTPLQEQRMNQAPIPKTYRSDTRDACHISNPRTDIFAIREKSEDSLVSQTQAYAQESPISPPGSPVTRRTHVRSSSSLSLTRSESDVTVYINKDGRQSSSMLHLHNRASSPSIYSLATAGSETSLVLAHRPRKSAYDDTEALQSLNRDGTVPGIFPAKHFMQNIRRFCRFSSASYGSHALKVMGVPRLTSVLPAEEVSSPEHSDFSDHTGLPASTILLSSFVDSAGGTNAAGETESGIPLVHYLSLDHESKAVVLTLRGTWGFEDILTDMTCEYDDLEWQGRSWKVHKGMHASAKRLLMGGGGRVMLTIRAALEEFSDYGLVLCGHSLGGGVAALLATMISEPSSDAFGASFTTTSYQTTNLSPSDNKAQAYDKAFFVPSGRPIHVYAYGPPATMSPFLRRATRGLITTIVNGQDVVPCLSLGILHDMHTVAVAFKGDVSGARSHVGFRVWEGFRQSIVSKFYVNEPPILTHAGYGVGEDAWAWNTLKKLREEMRAPKLLPPGEVFLVETMRVLQRNAFTSDVTADGYPVLGRPATRAQLTFVRDVESSFGELRFGSGMFSDHNPARYEASLAALARGVLDE
ncbi:lipase family protein [Aspergillus saccharolyticus JOP 1030-1]|uniref:sn-1-specific diacylglycerol lipase n=1 Tax=Aspergillus saccharolyticus JOP 1030-1 TaxID=1450539 RepID=A0A318ZF80_9EURO|nr:lipase [Aspergillus saccharolyticus JOP 1030-1]PYH45337.1 lipase [Aspergillus saccharolyticus JOP 1030-1]